MIHNNTCFGAYNTCTAALNSDKCLHVEIERELTLITHNRLIQFMYRLIGVDLQSFALLLFFGLWANMVAIPLNFTVEYYL